MKIILTYEASYLESLHRTISVRGIVKMLETTALALHSNMPSPREMATTTDKINIKKKQSIIAPSYSGQGLKSATVIWGKQKSFGDCTLSTDHGGLKSVLCESLYGPHSWQHPCFDSKDFDSYLLLCIRSLAVWKLGEDGRLFRR